MSNVHDRTVQQCYLSWTFTS